MSRPCFEALPQRLFGSRRTTSAGVTRSAGAWVATARAIASVARGLPDQQFVLRIAAGPLDGRLAMGTGHRHDTDSVQLAPVMDPRAILGPAERGDLGSLAVATREVPQHPCLALAEERIDAGIPIQPAPPRRAGDAHDEPAPLVDRDPQAPRPGTSSEHVPHDGAVETDLALRLRGRDRVSGPRGRE
jgi:hypothetical protein